MKIPDWKPLLLLSLILYSAVAYTQNNTIDSLQKVLLMQKEDTGKVNTLNKLSTLLWHSNDYKKALQVANEATTLSQRLNFKDGEAQSYVIIGTIYMSQDQYINAFEYTNEGLKLYKQSTAVSEVGNTYIRLGRICLALYKYSEGRKYLEEGLAAFKASDNTNGMAEAYLNIGELDRLEENFPQALKKLYTALKLYEQNADKSGYGSTYQAIGYTSYDMGNYTEALKNHSAALNTFRETENHYGVACANKNIGDVYLKLGNWTEALNYEMIALNYFKKASSPGWMASTYTSIGNIYEAQGISVFQAEKNEIVKEKFRQALSYYLLGLKINEITGFNLDESYLKLGNIYTRLNRLPEAKQNLERSLIKAKETNYKQVIKDVYHGLSVVDSIQGHYKEAYENYRFYVLYRDSLINEESIKKASQEKMQYEYDKKEAFAKAEQAKKEDESRQMRKLQYFIIGVFLLSTVFLFIYSRQKQKSKIKIEKAYTELKTTQAQLVQSAKMASLGELTAGIAHEIQNPLNFVNNFSDVNAELISEMKQEIDKGNIDEVKAIATDIEENEKKINHHGKRADAIVKGMLQHSRTSTGQKEPTDINKLADEYLRLSYQGFRVKDASFNVTMHTDFDTKLKKINIIPQEIGRVLLNLYNNAFYAVNEKKNASSGSASDTYEPTVSVSTKKIGDKIEIMVKDNGSGIPQNIIDKVFQPFFTTKPTGQGTGLGLSLSYDIIKAHGGEISTGSGGKVRTKEKEETVFLVELPVQ